MSQYQKKYVIQAGKNHLSILSVTILSLNKQITFFFAINKREAKLRLTSGAPRSWFCHCFCHSRLKSAELKPWIAPQNIFSYQLLNEYYGTYNKKALIKNISILWSVFKPGAKVLAQDFKLALEKMSFFLRITDEVVGKFGCKFFFRLQKDKKSNFGRVECRKKTATSKWN